MDNENSNKFTIIEINGKKYIKICRSGDVFEKKGKRFQIEDDYDKQVAIFRVNGKLYCFQNICPHRHQDQIHNAIIKDNTISCPLHGWTYYLETGDNTNPRQGRKKLDTFEIFERDGYIYIEYPEFKIPKWRRETNDNEIIEQ